jgi:KUP system potassium uptake protein
LNDDVVVTLNIVFLRLSPLADVIVIVAVVILIGLFCMQHYGTDKVGWLFAPIVLLWFILIGSVGALNIHKYSNGSVLKAYNPVYIFRYFRRGKAKSWTSLGGIMLSITGHIKFNCSLCIHYKMKQSYLYPFLFRD